MAKTEENPDARPKQRSKMPVLIGLVLFMAGGGGGFYAVYSRLLPLPESPPAKSAETEKTGAADQGQEAVNVAFVPIPALVISLNDGSGAQLRFRAQLEIEKVHKADVERLMPRVVDVLNSYLRAVKVADLRKNAVLVRLRAQMLRRVQVVVGPGSVRDLLIMEFVMN